MINTEGLPSRPNVVIAVGFQRFDHIDAQMRQPCSLWPISLLILEPDYLSGDADPVRDTFAAAFVVGSPMAGNLGEDDPGPGRIPVRNVASGSPVRYSGVT